MKDSIAAVLMVLFVVLIIAWGVFAFKSCYDDHRNQLGFSKTSSITSCSS